MAFDLSRQLYPHPACGTLPCSCQRTHKPLHVTLLTCQTCTFTAYTVSALHEHHLDRHERAIPGNWRTDITVIGYAKRVECTA